MWHLYVLIRNSKCVYVGSTSNIDRRKKQHKKNKVFDELFVLKSYDSKELCFNAENSIIRFLTLFGDGDWYNAEETLLTYKRDLEIRNNIYERRLD